MANTHKRIYSSWSHMKRRCYDAKSPDFVRYGARGIRVCDRWQRSANFLEDMALSYIDGYTLDRIDNNGNYEPSNCRWASPKQQANNTRRNRIITITGVTKTLAQWIEQSGLKPSTVKQRYYVYGWPIEKALNLELGGK